ncbi:MAG: rRNA maturation RNase YbeY [Chlamydiota bacterium]
MDIYVENIQNNYSLNTHEVAPLVNNVIELEGQKCDEVGIYFVDSAEISRLHDQYFDDPSTTDCISFPIDPPGEDPRFLGEVFVCPQTAQDYIDVHGGNLYEEISLYLVHGLLHLLGYDDLTPEDLQEMREAERKHIDNLKAKNLLLTGR